MRKAEGEPLSMKCNYATHVTVAANNTSVQIFILKHIHEHYALNEEGL